jgi:cyclopropane fatty-acyl-phospholipid synthase-like methyltransferase
MSVEVVQFYDNYVALQNESGLNERVFALFSRIKKLGLNEKSSILELGCGIGTMTYLLSKVVTRGVIEAIDISPSSIALAKKKNKKSNVLFDAFDITEYYPKRETYDFITLFDVIEHIPMHLHDKLFKMISDVSNENTTIVINIPNPECTKYDQIHHPDALQIIDLPLELEFIIKNIYANGLMLHSFENHSVWVEEDYQFFVIKKQRSFTENKLSSKRTFLQKVIRKFKNLRNKLFFKYFCICRVLVYCFMWHWRCFTFLFLLQKNFFYIILTTTKKFL